MTDSGAETVITIPLFLNKVAPLRGKTPLKQVIYSRIADFLPTLPPEPVAPVSPVPPVVPTPPAPMQEPIPSPITGQTPVPPPALVEESPAPEPEPPTVYHSADETIVSSGPREQPAPTEDPTLSGMEPPRPPDEPERSDKTEGE